MSPPADVAEGANASGLADVVAETGPGLSDDAVLDGELAPGELDDGADAAIAQLRRNGWAPGDPRADVDADQGSAEEESEAHPS